MNTTPPLAENSAALKSLDEFAKEYCMHLDEHHGLYDLPRNIHLQRFVGDGFIQLVGQYSTEDRCHPPRTYRIEIQRRNDPSATTFMIYEDARLIMNAVYCGSPSRAEYVAIKALKAELHHRVKHCTRTHEQRKKRAAAKTETTN